MLRLPRWLKVSIGNELAIDLGTATTLIYMKNKGIVLDEPSVVAVDKTTGKPLAVGDEAKRMLGKTPGDIIAKRPMKDGVIADFELVQEMLHTFIKKVTKKALLTQPKVLIAVPSGITEVEARAVKDSAESAGAREVHLVSEPIAAAVGIGLPIHEATGNMVIDIGGGTTEIAVIALFGIVTNVSIRVAGDEMDEAIIDYIRRKYKLLIGEIAAERVKMEIGTAIPLKEQKEIEIKGRDLITGIPKTLRITSEEVTEALKEPLSQIIDAIKKALEKTPPELSADIIENGIYLTGGGALLKGIDKLIEKETGLNVKVAEDPRKCVVIGAGKILEDLERYSKVLRRPKKIYEE
jgi:rod shape-determining protein MreB